MKLLFFIIIFYPQCSLTIICFHVFIPFFFFQFALMMGDVVVGGGGGCRVIFEIAFSLPYYVMFYYYYCYLNHTKEGTAAVVAATSLQMKAMHIQIATDWHSRLMCVLRVWNLIFQYLSVEVHFYLPFFMMLFLSLL